MSQPDQFESILLTLNQNLKKWLNNKTNLPFSEMMTVQLTATAEVDKDKA